MKPIHSVIIILLAANLAATIWFGTQSQNTISAKGKADTTVHNLPDAISSDVRKQLLEKFTVSFNNKDFDALYNMFGPAAKAQVTRESMDEQFNKLIKFFGAIEDGAFTHSELAKTQGSSKVYVLYYTVKLSKESQFGSTGNLRVTLAVQNNDFEVYGIYLNSDSHS